MICLIFSPKRLIFLSGQTRKKVYLFHDILMKTRLAVVRDNPVHSEFQHILLFHNSKKEHLENQNLFKSITVSFMLQDRSFTQDFFVIYKDPSL